jgi:glutathione S-transferase
MHQPHIVVAIVTILSVLTYLTMGVRVAAARKKSGIAAPAMTGDPELERTIRAHYNTLEWLPIYLVGLWLFAIYWNDLIAAAMGAIWIIGRILYVRGYIKHEDKRELGFMVQALATAVLLLGALGRLVYLLVTVGPA